MFITKTDGQTTYSPGATVIYTIVASNSGPGAVVGATVTDNFSPQITSASFSCSGSGGGTCPASGSGNINALVNLPSGSSVTFQVLAQVSASSTGDLVNTATIQPPAGVTDTNQGNNSATDTNTLRTTAGGVEISGRVLTPDGRGLRNARVALLESNGTIRVVMTNSFGYYSFDDIAAGQTCVLAVNSRRYKFGSRSVEVLDTLTDVDFVGLE